MRMGKACNRLNRCLLMVNLKSPVLWPPDPLVPMFAGDQPSESSQQGPTLGHKGCLLAQGSLSTAVFPGLTETSKVVKCRNAPQGGVNQ